MTDKQIIIDDVDVSGCNFTTERDGKIKCECTHATGFGVICDCESWKTCDYKNYKRKEQECEELKEDRERWKSNFNGKVSAIEELLQQLDQLKAKNIKIYKTLAEIKEIAEKEVKHAPDGETFTRPEIKQILQKISEVENAR